jgi:AcrR family transcriptional regulator
MAGPAPTRQRLIDVGMRLFADQGFRATSVGDIEAAAGLQPRRGALYKHFPSKSALLQAAVRSYLDSASTGATQLSRLDLSGAVGPDRAVLRTIVLGLGRWFLDEMDRLRDLTRVLEHDGQRLAEVTAEIKTDIVDLSYRSAAPLIVAIAPEARDPEATALLVLGPLVALRRTAWTFGSPPLGIDDDRALAAWADLTLAALDPGRPVEPG